MVTNAQLDNEKTSLQYQVDTLREVLQELEEELAESRRQYEDKQKVSCGTCLFLGTDTPFNMGAAALAIETPSKLLDIIRH